MPHISISMYSGRTDEQKADIAAKAKAAVAEACGFPPDAVSVSVRDIDPDQFVDEVNARIADDTLLEPSALIR